MAPAPKTFALACYRNNGDLNYRTERMTKDAAERLLLDVEETGACSLDHHVEALNDEVWIRAS